MASTDFQALAIYTKSPAATATLDVRVGITDSTGTRTWKIDASDRGEIALFASGSALGAVSDALKIDISSQALAGVKTSRDGAAPTAANGIFAEVTTANAVLAANNPLPAQLSQGGAVLTATNGLFSNVLQGNAVLTMANPIFAALSQDGLILSATNGLFTNVLQGDAALTAANALPVILSDGDTFNNAANPVFSALSHSGTAVSAANPLPVTLANPQVTGTLIYPYKRSAAPIAENAADTHTITGSGANDAYIESIVVEAPGYVDFVIKRGATTLHSVRLSPTHPTFQFEYPEDEPLKVLNGVNLTIEGTNLGKDTLLITSWAVGYEKAP